MDPHNRTGPQTSRNFAWRDYGNQVGNWCLFEMLDELILPASILLNSAVCYQYAGAGHSDQHSADVSVGSLGRLIIERDF
jgi:hypothetical protein